MTLSRFSFPTTIHFGPGARKLVGPHLASRACARPLVVTDKGLAALPLFAELTGDLAGAGLDVAAFGGVFGNPTASQAMAGAAAYRAHRADCVVGIGGGAALDVAKVVGADRDARRRRVRVRVTTTRRCARSTPSVPYFVALPTTSGTGSEVGRSAVISDDQTHVKRIVFSPHILAKVGLRRPGADARTCRPQ